MEIVDTVLVPDDIETGDYVIGWRYDCEESTQVMPPHVPCGTMCPSAISFFSAESCHCFGRRCGSLVQTSESFDPTSRRPITLSAPTEQWAVTVLQKR